MKLLLSLLSGLILTTGGLAQTSNSQYNAELARELGADDYGMKTYVLVILKSGTNPSTNQAEIDSAFAGHMKNISRLAEEGSLVVAGPMQKNAREYRGIFILDVSKLEEAQTLLQTDPAIAANFLEPELFVWYGSAALPAYLDTHDKIWKSGF